MEIWRTGLNMERAFSIQILDGEHGETRTSIPLRNYQPVTTGNLHLNLFHNAS